MSRKEQPPRTQVSVIIEDGLRERLENAARRSIRSLSGEIAFRLLESLERDAAVEPTAA
jgi:hypothetical protein